MENEHPHPVPIMLSTIAIVPMTSMNSMVWGMEGGGGCYVGPLIVWAKAWLPTQPYATLPSAEGPCRDTRSMHTALHAYVYVHGHLLCFVVVPIEPAGGSSQMGEPRLAAGQTPCTAKPSHRTLAQLWKTNTFTPCRSC